MCGLRLCVMRFEGITNPLLLSSYKPPFHPTVSSLHTCPFQILDPFTPVRMQLGNNKASPGCKLSGTIPKRRMERGWATDLVLLTFAFAFLLFLCSLVGFKFVKAIAKIQLYRFLWPSKSSGGNTMKPANTIYIALETPLHMYICVQYSQSTLFLYHLNCSI